MSDQNKNVRARSFEHGYAAAAGTIWELNVKLIQMARANAAAALDLAHQIVTADRPSNLPSVWSDYVKRQFELLTSQAAELTALGQNIGAASKSETEIAEPAKEGQARDAATDMPRFEASHLARLAEARKKKTATD